MSGSGQRRRGGAVFAGSAAFAPLARFARSVSSVPSLRSTAPMAATRAGDPARAVRSSGFTGLGRAAAVAVLAGMLAALCGAVLVQSESAATDRPSSSFVTVERLSDDGPAAPTDRAHTPSDAGAGDGDTTATRDVGDGGSGAGAAEAAGWTADGEVDATDADGAGGVDGGTGCRKSQGKGEDSLPAPRGGVSQQTPGAVLAESPLPEVCAAFSTAHAAPSVPEPAPIPPSPVELSVLRV